MMNEVMMKNRWVSSNGSTAAFVDALEEGDYLIGQLQKPIRWDDPDPKRQATTSEIAMRKAEGILTAVVDIVLLVPFRSYPVGFGVSVVAWGHNQDSLWVAQKRFAEENDCELAPGDGVEVLEAGGRLWWRLTDWMRMEPIVESWWGRMGITGDR